MNPSVAPPVPRSASAMTPAERRASLSLASVFALRMLGLFLVLPVFMLEARHYPGGEDLALVGLAMGAYGLTQALLQIPFGLASDRWGRKPVIYAGLALFATGSLVAAWAPSVHWLLVGRVMQGAGAMSAAITALLADLTRDEVRTKGMALVGASIGLTFALSLMVSPPLTAAVGLSGIFALTAALALAGMAAVRFWTPPEPPLQPAAATLRGWSALWHRDLWRLNIGVFALHGIQVAMWMAVPALLTSAGLPQAEHWKVYVPAVGLSFLLMGGLFALERRGHLRWALRGAVLLLALVQAGFFWHALGQAQLLPLAGLLFAFFVAFNVMEASQPSLVSRLAPPGGRGAALGVYNTLQSLGFFVGGAAGGWLVKWLGSPALFLGCLAVAVLWLALAWGQPVPPPPAQSAKAQ